MKPRHWFSAASLFGALVIAVLGSFKGAVALVGLSSLIEIVAAMVNDKNRNV